MRTEYEAALIRTGLVGSQDHVVPFLQAFRELSQLERTAVIANLAHDLDGLSGEEKDAKRHSTKVLLDTALGVDSAWPSWTDGQASEIDTETACNVLVDLAAHYPDFAAQLGNDVSFARHLGDLTFSPLVEEPAERALVAVAAASRQGSPIRQNGRWVDGALGKPVEDPAFRAAFCDVGQDPLFHQDVINGRAGRYADELLARTSKGEALDPRILVAACQIVEERAQNGVKSFGALGGPSEVLRPLSGLFLHPDVNVRSAALSAAGPLVPVSNPDLDIVYVVLGNLHNYSRSLEPTARSAANGALQTIRSSAPDDIASLADPAVVGPLTGGPTLDSL